MSLAFCFWLRGSPCTDLFMHLLYCFDVTLCIKGFGDLHNVPVHLCKIQLYFGQVLWETTLWDPWYSSLVASPFKPHWNSGQKYRHYYTYFNLFTYIPRCSNDVCVNHQTPSAYVMRSGFTRLVLNLSY